MPVAEHSLRERMEAGDLSQDEIITVLTDVAAALASLNDQVVHRDIKPETFCGSKAGGVSGTLASLATPRPPRLPTPRTTHSLRPTRRQNGGVPNEQHQQPTSTASGFSLMSCSGSGSRSVAQVRKTSATNTCMTSPQLMGVGSALAALIDECPYKAPAARPTPANCGHAYSACHPCHPPPGSIDCARPTALKSPGTPSETARPPWLNLTRKDGMAWLRQLVMGSKESARLCGP